MEILITIAILFAVFGIQYLPIYLSYLFVSRKQVTQGKMHKVSFMVTGISIGCALITSLLNCTSVAFPITAVMVYQMGRSMLQQSNKQAWASCGIFIGISALLIAIVVYLLITNETFRMLMTEE